MNTIDRGIPRISDILHRIDNAGEPLQITGDLNTPEKVLAKMESYANSSHKAGMHMIQQVRDACDAAEEAVNLKRDNLMTAFASYVQTLELLERSQKDLTNGLSTMVQHLNGHD